MPRYVLTLPVQSYQGAPASNGVNHLIAAVPGASIYVVAYAIQATGTVNANFQDTGAVQLTPAWVFQAREGISRTAVANGYLLETAKGAGLDLNLSAGVGVNVELEYIVA